MGIVEARLVNEDDELAARVVEVRHSRGSFTTPTYAVNVFELDRRIIKEDDLQGVVEVSMSFKPERLSAINRDVHLQQQLEGKVNSYIGRVPQNQLVVVVPIVRSKQRRGLSLNEAFSYGTHIAELVAHPRADVVCTPIFHRVAEKNIEVLIEKFLEAMTSYNVGVALSIPYTSREMWEKLVEIYLRQLDRNSRALQNFLCVDYNGSNPISKYILHNYVLRYVKTLQEDIGEAVVIYGANVKYSNVIRKYDELPARDLIAYFTQLDMFGGNHKERGLTKEVAEKSKAEESLWREKLLNRERYTYINVEKMVKEPKLAIPEVEHVVELINAGHHISYIKKRVKRINVKHTLAETEVLKPLFSGKGWQHYEKPKQYLNSKEILKIDEIILKRLEAYNKVLKSRTKKLDEYT